MPRKPGTIHSSSTSSKDPLMPVKPQEDFTFWTSTASWETLRMNAFTGWFATRGAFGTSLRRPGAGAGEIGFNPDKAGQVNQRRE